MVKDEAMSMMKLGASMILLSGFLMYVLYAFILGKDIGTQFFGKTEEIQVQSETGSIQELEGIETIMPAATVFSLIQYQHKNIRQITCYVCNPLGEKRTINQEICIAEHLKGQVKILVEYDEAYGLFDISIWPF